MNDVESNVVVENQEETKTEVRRVGSSSGSSAGQKKAKAADLVLNIGESIFSVSSIEDAGCRFKCIPVEREDGRPSHVPPVGTKFSILSRTYNVHKAENGKWFELKLLPKMSVYSRNQLKRSRKNRR